MISRNDLAGVTFKQEHHSCMMASYGVALFPFTGREVVDYLADYAGIPMTGSPQLAIELAYRAAFIAELSLGKSNGLQTVETAHYNNQAASFITARSKANVQYLADGITLGTFLPDRWSTQQRALGVLTVNVGSAVINHAPSHAVTVGFDGAWFLYDVNVPSKVHSVAALSDIGQLGDALLITEL